MTVFGEELCASGALQECTLNMSVTALVLEIPVGQDPQLRSVSCRVSPAKTGK